ncbi:hypothetical protein T492DRAFT_1001601 [Pavlovales sp. CCMP2436]|nr:hypothetical protein T492DRAFT_1001601 [Pavlovales sp. CCMP2436]
MRCTLASLYLVGCCCASREPLRLRAWHEVTALNARMHGPATRTTGLDGSSTHIKKSLTLSFGARGRQHVLNMSRVQEPFPTGSTLSLIRNGIREPPRPPPKLALYSVNDARGRTRATATLLPSGQVRALVHDGEGFLVVEAATATHIDTAVGSAHRQPRLGQMITWRVSDAEVDFGDDEGLGFASGLEPHDGHIRQGASGEQNLRRTPHNSHGAHAHNHRGLSTFASCPSELHRFVMGMALDQLFVEASGGADEAVAFLASTLSFLNAVYSDQLNLEVVVDRLIVFDGASPIDLTLPPSYGKSSTIPDPGYNPDEGLCVTPTDSSVDNDDLIGAFRGWIRDYSEKRTAWHLMTGCDTPGSAAGYAALGISCSTISTGNNAGWSRGPRSYTWAVLAHEIGHNLGADHATDGGLMSAVLSIPVSADTQFSDNSQSLICNVLGTLISDGCVNAAAGEAEPIRHVTMVNTTLERCFNLTAAQNYYLTIRFGIAIGFNSYAGNVFNVPLIMTDESGLASDIQFDDCSTHLPESFSSAAFCGAYCVQAKLGLGATAHLLAGGLFNFTSVAGAAAGVEFPADWTGISAPAYQTVDATIEVCLAKHAARCGYTRFLSFS